MFDIPGPESEATCPGTSRTARPTESASSTGTTDSSGTPRGQQHFLLYADFKWAEHSAILISNHARRTCLVFEEGCSNGHDP